MGHLGGEKIQRTERVGEQHAGGRLDQVAAELFDGFSRSRLQGWIKQGVLKVNGQPARPKDKLIGGEALSLDVELAPEIDDQPEAIDLPVVYEDHDLIVINKPSGLVVHPAAGHAAGTLLNGLLHLDDRLSSLPRAGIVHRLDRDTTGLMVVARSVEAHTGLVAQLQDKSLYREYEAIAVGVMTGGGTVNAAIGRHPVDRKRQAVVQHGGKTAVTHYRVLDRYRAHTRIQVRLETGRTHQIRVHLSSAGLPIAGDTVYGRSRERPRSRGFRIELERPALHAARLAFSHPRTGERLDFSAPLADDLAAFEQALAAFGSESDST